MSKMMLGDSTLILPPLASLQHGHNSAVHAEKPFSPPKLCATSCSSPPQRPPEAGLSHASAVSSYALQVATVPPAHSHAEGGVVTLFPRRKAGQTRPGGGRGPVVLNLEMLEQYYGVPLHTAAKKLGICQTAIKKVCRRLGIKKWPYKEMRVPVKEEDVEEKECRASGSSSPTDVSAPVEATILVAAKQKLESDQDVWDAVRALLTLHSNVG